MDKFEPELGQAIFGQPHKDFEVPEIMDAAMQFIDLELSRVRWNIRQHDVASPFRNSGPDGNYDGTGFQVHAYDWGDDEQPWNFKWGNVEISWYKYAGRGLSANIDITSDMAAKCLSECLAEIRGLEAAPMTERRG